MPREACGLLFGEEGTISAAETVANVADEPELYFEIDPAALFAALRAERAGGARIAGYWHSHPSGDAQPSETDAGMAAGDGKLWLIAGGGEMTLWKAEEVEGRFTPVTITLG